LGCRSRLDGEEEKAEFVDSKQQAITVELVGADKAFEEQSKLENLRSVCVPGAPVRAAADMKVLGVMLPNVTELDISRTLFISWGSVATVITRLPKLSALRVCGMVFPAVAGPETSGAAAVAVDDDSRCGGGGGGAAVTAIPGVTELFFNLCAQSFDHGCGAPQIVIISAMFPHLSELHLGGNDLVSISDHTKQCIFPKTLEHLNVEDNRISDWGELLSLSSLPALTRLNVSKNALGDLPGLKNGGAFAALVVLNVSRNQLSGWDSVNELVGLAALREIVIGHNPVFESERGLHARQCIIGRVRQVERVNRTVVAPQERVVAERFFLARHAASWWKAKEAGDAAIASFHGGLPTFCELIATHGEPDKPKSDTVALKEGFVRLNVSNLNGDALPPLLLPATTTIAKLRQVLKAKKALSSENLTSAGLLYVDDDPDVHEILLDDNMRELGFFGAKAGQLKLV
jgi:hypothetical protein